MTFLIIPYSSHNVNKNEGKKRRKVCKGILACKTALFFPRKGSFSDENPIFVPIFASKRFTFSGGHGIIPLYTRACARYFVIQNGK